MFYEKNMKFLKDRISILYDIIREETSIYKVDIMPVQTTNLNYQVKTEAACCYLHSLYNIDDEMRSSIRNINKDTKVVVLFGFGCGYITNYIKQFDQIKKFIIIEPELNIFKQLMNDIDLSKLINGLNDFTIIINKKKEVISRYLYQTLIPHIGKDDIELVFNVSYRSLFPGYYEYMYENLIRLVRVKRVNLVSQKGNLYPQITNIIRNLYIPNIPVEEITEYIKDIPVIIVSAGPSLNKNIHLLNEVKDRAIIVAVGTAIKILHNHNIIPHFRAAGDGNKANVQLFNELDSSESILLYANTLYNGTVKDYNGIKVNLLSATEKLSKYVYDQLGYERIECNTGFSISTLILDLFARIGSPEIIFMGQDCSFSKELYAKGAERDHMKYSNVIKEKDIYGNEVYSLPVYTVIKDLIQLRITQYPKTKFYNATEGGLNIDGAENVRFQDILNRLDNNICVNDKLRQAFDNFNQDNITEWNKNIIEILSNIDNQIDECISSCYKFIKELKKIKKMIDSKGKNIKIKNKLLDLNYEQKLLENPFYKEVIYNKLEPLIGEIKPKFINRFNDEELDQLVKYKLALGTESLIYLKYMKKNLLNKGD